MTNKGPDALKKKFNAFSGRLDAKIKEFEERGELSTGREATSASLRKRQALLEMKLQAAIAKHREVDILKYEFERDMNNLAEDFEQFVRRIDAQSVKPRPRTRAR